MVVPTADFLEPAAHIAGINLQAEIEACSMTTDIAVPSPSPAHTPTPSFQSFDDHASNSGSNSDSEVAPQYTNSGRRRLPRRQARNKRVSYDCLSDDDDLLESVAKPRTGKVVKRTASATPSSASQASKKKREVIDYSKLTPQQREELEMQRLEKNRQSARDCRLRKKKYIQGLEAKLARAEQREQQREQEMRNLEAQLRTMKSKYATLLERIAQGRM